MTQKSQFGFARQQVPDLQGDNIAVSLCLISKHEGGNEEGLCGCTRLMAHAGLIYPPSFCLNLFRKTHSPSFWCMAVGGVEGERVGVNFIYVSTLILCVYDHVLLLNLLPGLQQPSSGQPGPYRVEARDGAGARGGRGGRGRAGVRMGRGRGSACNETSESPLVAPGSGSVEAGPPRSLGGESLLSVQQQQFQQQNHFLHHHHHHHHQQREQQEQQQQQNVEQPPTSALYQPYPLHHPGEKDDYAEEWRCAIHAFLLSEGAAATLHTLGTHVTRPAGITLKLISVVKHDPRFVVTGIGHDMAVGIAEASPSGELQAAAASAACPRRLGKEESAVPATHTPFTRLEPPLEKVDRNCLTQCNYQLVAEIQLPRETVNLIFQSVIVNNKFTILWGS